MCSMDNFQKTWISEKYKYIISKNISTNLKCKKRSKIIFCVFSIQILSRNKFLLYCTVVQVMQVKTTCFILNKRKKESSFTVYIHIQSISRLVTGKLHLSSSRITLPTRLNVAIPTHTVNLAQKERPFKFEERW